MDFFGTISSFDEFREIVIGVSPDERYFFRREPRDYFSLIPKKPLNELLASNRLRKYNIIRESRDSLRKELMLFGIHHASVFPDLDGLSMYLQYRLGENT